MLRTGARAKKNSLGALCDERARLDSEKNQRAATRPKLVTKKRHFLLRRKKAKKESEGWSNIGRRFLRPVAVESGANPRVGFFAMASAGSSCPARNRTVVCFAIGRTLALCPVTIASF